MNEVENINEYPIGGKSFDGQWTRLENNIVSGENYSANQSKTYDISSLLPDNLYDYEVYFSGTIDTGSTSGNRGDLFVRTGTINNNLCEIVTRTNSTRQTNGGAFYPISKNDQTITVTNAGQASKLWVRTEAYRRLGTNE